MSILAFLIIGLVAGLLARAIVPGSQHMGLVATTLLGMVGSFVGGLIGSVLGSDGRVWDLHPSSLLFSVLGAVAVLFLVSFSGRRRVRI